MNRAMAEALKLPQVNCPVSHTFMPGIYMRETTIPAGTYAIGQNNRFSHIDILVKGRVTIFNQDGSATEMKAPRTIISNPGRSCGHVHEDAVLISVYPVGCTDVEEIENIIYDNSDVPLSPDKEAKAAREDHREMLAGWGLTPEQVGIEATLEYDMVQMPYGIFKVKVSDSSIHGKGVFATGNIAAGEIVAPAELNGRRTPIGRYMNHSGTPNAKMDIMDGNVYLTTLRDVKGCHGGRDGEELLINYREHLELIGRDILQAYQKELQP